MDLGKHESISWGKKHLNIEGYYRTFQPRVSPDGEFGNEDRKWRQQWLKDQHLKGADLHSSPIDGTGLNQYQLEQIPEWRKARWNIFRRTLRVPMDIIEGGIIKAVGMPYWTAVRSGRNMFSYGWKIMAVTYMFSYHLMYKSNNWEEKNNWKITYQKPISLPSDDGILPSQEEFKRETTDYWNQNFKQSEVASSGVKATSKGYC